MSQCITLSNTGTGSDGGYPSGVSGDPSHVKTPNVPALNFQGNPFTIFAMVNCSSGIQTSADNSGRGAPIISHIEYDSGSPYNGFELTILTDEVRLYVWNAGSVSYARAYMAGTKGDIFGMWHRIAVRKDGAATGNWKIYIDGVSRLVGTGGAGASTDTAIGDIDSGTGVNVGLALDDGPDVVGLFPGYLGVWVYDQGFTNTELVKLTTPSNAIDPEDDIATDFFDSGTDTLFEHLAFRVYTGKSDWETMGSGGTELTSADPVTGVINLFECSADSLIGIIPVENAIKQYGWAQTVNNNETQNKCAKFSTDGYIYAGYIGPSGYNKGIAKFDASTGALVSIFTFGGAGGITPSSNDWLIGPYHSSPVLAAGVEYVYAAFSSALQGPNSVKAYRIASGGTALTAGGGSLYNDGSTTGAYYLGMMAYDNSGTDRVWLSAGQRMNAGNIRAVIAYSDDHLDTLTAEFNLIEDASNSFVCNTMHAEDGVVVAVANGLYGTHGLAVTYSYDDCSNVYALKNAASGYAMTLGSETKSSMSSAGAFAWESDGNSWRMPSKLIYDSATRQGWLICTGSDVGGEAFYQGRTPSGEPTGTVGVYILKFTLPETAGSATGATYEWFGPFFAGSISRDGGIYDAKFIDSDRIGIIAQAPFRDAANEPSGYVDYPDGAQSLRIFSAPWDNPSAMKAVGLLMRPTGGSDQPFIDTYRSGVVHAYCWGMGQVIQSARWVLGDDDAAMLFLSDQRFTGQQQEFAMSRVVLQSVEVPVPSSRRGRSRMRHENPDWLFENQRN